MTTIVITGDRLSAADVVAVARDGATVEVGAQVAARMEPARRVVVDAVARGDIVYGITTGFGALASTRVEPAESTALQVALLRSHAAGVGPALADDLVRAMLLLRPAPWRRATPGSGSRWCTAWWICFATASFPSSPGRVPSGPPAIWHRLPISLYP
jgi:histidine ammonia-lyase